MHNDVNPDGYLEHGQRIIGWATIWFGGWAILHWP